MSLFYQERIKRSKVPFLAAMVAAAVGLLTLSNMIKAFSGNESSQYLDWMLLGLFAIVVIGLRHSSKRQIRYSLVQSEILIQEESSGKLKIMDRVSLNQILSFKPVNLSEKLICVSSDASCLIHKAWKLTYEKNGRLRTIIMRHSDRLASKIDYELAHQGAH